MTVTIRAHFDRKLIVPDEPADLLPVGKPLSVSVEVAAPARFAPHTAPEEQQAAYEELLKSIREREWPHIPDEALRRENMYGDDGRR